MRCKFCRRDIPENSMFCNWCGKKQLKDKTEISVPAPRRLKSGTWFAQLMVKGERIPISGSTEAEYYAKARAAKAGLLEAKKPDNRLVKDLVADSMWWIIEKSLNKEGKSLKFVHRSGQHVDSSQRLRADCYYSIVDRDGNELKRLTALEMVQFEEKIQEYCDFMTGKYL